MSRKPVGPGAAGGGKLTGGNRTSLLGEALGDVRQRWQEAKAEAASLRVELAEADAEKKALKAALKRETDRAAQISEELKHMKDGDDASSLYAKQATAELEQVRKSLHEAHVETRTLRETLKAKEHEVDLAKKQSTGNTRETEGLRAELKELKETLDDERESLEEARAELAMLRVSAQASETARSTELRTNTETINELSLQNSEMESIVRKLEEKIKGLVAESNRHKGDQERWSENANALADLKRSYSNLQRQLEDAEDSKEEREKELQETIGELKKKVKAAEAERDEFEAHRDSAEDALEEAKETVMDLQGKLDRFGTRASHLETELTESNRLVKQAKEETTRDRTRLAEELAGVRRDLENEKAESRRARADAENRIETLKNRANAVVRERDEARASLFDVQGRAEAAEKTVAEQKFQLEKARSASTDVESELRELRAAIEDADTESASLAEQLQGRESEVIALKRRLETTRKEAEEYKSAMESSASQLEAALSVRETKEGEVLALQKKNAADLRVAAARESELRDEVETLRDDAERTNAVLSRCRKDLEDVRRQMADVRTANSQLQLDVSSANDSRDAAVAELANVQAALASAREKTFALEAEKDDFSSELSNKLAVHEHQLTLQVARTEDAEKRLEAMRKAKAALERSHVEDLEAKERVHRESADALKRSLDDASKAKAEAVRRADELSRLLNDAVLEREEQATAFTRLQKDNLEFQDGLEKQGLEIQKHLTTIQELRSLVDGTSDAKQREVAALKKGLEEARRQAEEASARADQTRKGSMVDMESLKTERNNMAMRLESLEKEHNVHVLAMEETKRELAESEAARRALQEKDLAINSQMDYLKVQLKSATERSETLSEKVRETENSLLSTRREADGNLEKNEERLSELRRDLATQRSQQLQLQEALRERDRIIEMVTRERDANAKRAEEFEHLRHEEMLRSAKKRSTLELEVDARERAAAHLAALLRKERRKSETAMALALINTSPEGDGVKEGSNGSAPNLVTDDKSTSSRDSAKALERWSKLAAAAKRKLAKKPRQRPWWQAAAGAWLLRSVMVTPVALVAQLVSDNVSRARENQKLNQGKRRRKATPSNASAPKSMARTVESNPTSVASTPGRTDRSTPASSPMRPASAPASQPDSRASSAPASPMRASGSASLDGKPPVPPPPERKKGERPPMEYRG